MDVAGDESWSETNNGNRDGRWVVLQDWSQCSLACNGGVSLLQRYCVDPVGSGRPCAGGAILSKPCNTHKCKPPVHNVKYTSGSKVGQVEVTVEAPRLKVMQASKRYQRTETCIVKEGDLDWMREDLGAKGQYPRFPVRAILNNRTFTVFENNHYDTIAFSTNLNAIKSIKKHPSDEKNCFVIENDDDRRITLCAMRSDTHDSGENIKNEWVRQIYYFRDYCEQKHAIHVFTDDVSKIITHQIEEAKLEGQNEHNEFRRQQKMEDNSSYKVKQAEQIAISVSTHHVRTNILWFLGSQQGEQIRGSSRARDETG